MTPLEVLNIETPCTASWEAMPGDAKVRHCPQCHLDVYDLSAMTRDEAQRVVQENEGHLCARVWKRADGTVITQDCASLKGEPRACAPRFVHRAAAETPSLARGAEPVHTVAPQPRVMRMGSVAARPLPALRLEAPGEALGHDTVLVELARAVRASFDADRIEPLLRSIERALGPRMVGTEKVAPEAGRNAGCPLCEGPLWLQPRPSAEPVALPVPVSDGVESRKTLRDELDPAVQTAFGERGSRLLREILRTGFGNGLEWNSAPCPHCAAPIRVPGGN